MNTVRALARVPGGRRTKWLVLIFWLLVVAVAGPLAGKLTDAENNDASSWLPGKRRVDQVAEPAGQVPSPNVFPASSSTLRDAGLTAADKAKAAADAAPSPRHRTSPARSSARRVPGRQGAARPSCRSTSRNDGWNNLTPAVDQLRATASRGGRADRPHHRSRRAARRTRPRPSPGIDGTLLYATLGVVIVLLLLTYRSPTLWLLPRSSSRARADHRRGA